MSGLKGRLGYVAGVSLVWCTSAHGTADILLGTGLSTRARVLREGEEDTGRIRFVWGG